MMNRINDPTVDTEIRDALRRVDAKGKLGTLAAVVGVSGGAETLREIINETGEMNIIDRGMLLVYMDTDLFCK